MSENYLKRANWIDVVISTLFAIIGVGLTIKPTEMVNFIAIFIGMVLFIISFLKIVDYFISNDKQDYLLTIALVSAILGVIVLCCADIITGFFRIILGIWIIIEGVRNFQTALIWKDVKSKLWTVSVICTLLMIIAGIVVLVSSTLAIRIVGGVILTYAILDIISRIIFIKEIQNIINRK